MNAKWKLGFLENVSHERPCANFGVFGSVPPKPTVSVFRAFFNCSQLRLGEEEGLNGAF
jgi:hypothetical protein